MAKRLATSGKAQRAKAKKGASRKASRSAGARKKGTAKSRRAVTAKKAAARNSSTGKAAKSGSAASSATKRVGKTSVVKAASKARKATRAGTKTTATKAAKTKSPKTRTSSKKRPSAAKPEATSLDPIQFPDEGRRLPKTHLSRKELSEFKQLLLAKRTELTGDVSHLRDGAAKKTVDGSGEHSAMPVHMADLGTDNWEQEFTLDLIASEHAMIREIDDALARIGEKTYGVCLATHKKISLARLRAKPWAKYCIDYARAREEGRAI